MALRKCLSAPVTFAGNDEAWASLKDAAGTKLEVSEQFQPIPDSAFTGK